MNKRLILITSIFLTILALIGCVKKIEKVTTVLSGRVIEESQSMPLNNVNVVVTNGNQEYTNTHTGVTGTFKLDVTFDDLNDNYYLYLDDGNHNKRLDLKGVGKSSYDYKDIALYKDSGGGGVNTPTVTTSSVSNVTTYSVTCGGNVTEDGGAIVTARGVCWNTSGNPTISNQHTTDGTGTGQFTSTITGLSANTTYYVKAYATNSAGTSYGTQKTFTTSGGGGSAVEEFSESFESGIPSNWATIDADGDGNNWYSLNPNNNTNNIPGHNGSLGHMTSASYNGSVLTPDNYLVTPLVKATNNSTFSFYACAQDNQWVEEHFGVFVSTNSQTNANSFVKIQEWTMTAKSSGITSIGRDGQTRDQGNWYQYTVSLGSYANQNIYVAIRHFNSSDMFRLNVDDVELSASGGGGGGQTYSYTFESGLQNWTSLDADGDGYGWVLGSQIGGVYLESGTSLAGNGHDSSTDLVCSGSYTNYTSSALYPDNYLVSPQKYTITAGARISFYVCAQDSEYPAEHFGVAISTSSNPSSSSFTTIWEETLSAKTGKSEIIRGNRDQGTWYLKTIDLSSYSGQTIWIAIRHFDCSDQFILDIDDITIITGN